MPGYVEMRVLDFVCTREQPGVGLGSMNAEHSSCIDLHSRQFYIGVGAGCAFLI